MTTLHAPSSPATSLAALPRHANLIRELVARDVRDRYSGSMLGMLWALVTPIVLIAIYSIVFGAVFGARIPGMEERHSSTFGFGVYLFSGLLLFTIFSEVIARAPTLVWSHPNYVKKVVFPLEALPLVVTISALVHSILPLAVLLLAAWFVLGSLPWTALLYPLAVVLMIPMVQGLAWMLAAIGAYMRDMGQVIGLLMTVLMFMSPIFFPVAKFPPWVQPAVRLNPISIPVEIGQALVFGAPAPPIEAVVAYAACSIIVFFAGWKLFGALRSGFADVI